MQVDRLLNETGSRANAAGTAPLKPFGVEDSCCRSKRQAQMAGIAQEEARLLQCLEISQIHEIHPTTGSARHEALSKKPAALKPVGS